MKPFLRQHAFGAIVVAAFASSIAASSTQAAAVDLFGTHAVSSGSDALPYSLIEGIRSKCIK